MDTELELLDENRPPSEETGLGRLAGWLLGLIRRNPDGLRAFADHLVAAFRPGFEVGHRASGAWFATLDAIDPEDNQVAALVRLSRQSLKTNGPWEVRQGMVDVEERDRKLFSEPDESVGADADLLLTYSFPLLLSLDQNLELFREFAGNELSRLRGHDVSESAGTSQTRSLVATDQPGRR
jgi:hypothetical protein